MARIAKIEALSARLRSEAVSTKRGSRMPVTVTSATKRDDDPQLADAEDPLGEPARACALDGGAAHAATCPVAARMTFSSFGLVAADLRRQAPLVHDQHAVGHAEHLGQLAGDHQHGQPLAGQLAHQPVHLGLGADVDAAGRLVDDQQLRLGGEPLREHDLLLVAARQEPDGVLEPVELQLQARRPLARQRVLGGAADQAAARQRAGAGHRRVAGDREVHHEALLAAVLGHEADPGAHRGQRPAGGEPVPVDLDVAGVRLVDAEDRAGDLAAARADEPGQRDDLARLDLEGDVEEHALAREPVHLEHRRADLGVAPWGTARRGRGRPSGAPARRRRSRRCSPRARRRRRASR